MFLGALLVAGALTAAGALIGVAVPWGARLVVGVGVLVALGLVELAGRAGRLPQNRRLVPQTILASDNLVGPLQFGFEMGTGMRTFVPSALPLALVAMALLFSPDALAGLAMGAGFGAGRALAIPARRRDPEAWDRRMSSAAGKAMVRLCLGTSFALTVVGLLVR